MLRGRCRSAVLLLCIGWPTALALSPGRASEPAHGSAPAAGSQPYDAFARFIAGLPSHDAALTPLQERRSWVEYARPIDIAWQKLESRQLGPMRTWSTREIGARSHSGQIVLYPFSGPDLINPTTILPGHEAYVLLSLEPVGMIPDFGALDEASFDAFFAGMKESLSSALRWDFFQTKELRQDLTVPGLEGVLPLLLFFASRGGHEVTALDYLFVAADGTLERTPATPGRIPEGQGVPGVRIALRNPDTGAVRRVDYFSVDLSSHSLDRRRAFFSFVTRRGPFTTYLKAASYLMFKPKYAGISHLVLGHSQDVLQDDSGIPLAELMRRGWQVKLYGSYERPIRLFAHRYQEDLAEAYRTRTDVSPLPFAVGYKIRPGSSTLMWARKPGG